MKVQEVINLINSNKCNSIWEAEELIEDHYNTFINSVADDIDISRHEYFEVSMSVYKCDDGYVGICGVTRVYNELTLFEDCGIQTEAYRVVPYQTISYKIVNNKENGN